MADAKVFRANGSEISFGEDGSINVKSAGDFTFTGSAPVAYKGSTSDFIAADSLTLRAYQAGAAKTAIYPDSAAILYPVLGLAGEAGEVAGKVKKVIRDSGGVFTPEIKAAIAAELGDVLWYLAATARDLDIELADIAQGNLDKLASRMARNVIGGSGDNR